jgi:hypothetical protein
MIKGEKWVMGGKKLQHLFFLGKEALYISLQHNHRIVLIQGAMYSSKQMTCVGYAQYPEVIKWNNIPTEWGRVLTYVKCTIYRSNQEK